MKDSPDSNVLIVNTASGFCDAIILGVEHRLAKDRAQEVGADRGYEATVPPVELVFLSQVADDKAESDDQNEIAAIGPICHVLAFLFHDAFIVSPEEIIVQDLQSFSLVHP